MPTLLLVDDSASILALLGDALSQAGFDVRPAVNGRDAMRELRSRRFDVIVTDIYMPEADGLELIVALTLEGQRTPVIAMSSMRGRMDMLKTAARLGARKTLYKPFPPAELVQLARSLIEERPTPATTSPLPS